MTDDALPNTTIVYEEQRRQVIEEMGFSVSEPLAPGQDNRVHAVVMLKFLRANVTSQVLAGQCDVDPKAIASISTQLEELQNPRVGGDSPEGHEREDRIVTEELDELIARARDARQIEQTSFFALITKALDRNKPHAIVLTLLDLLAHARVTDASLDRARQYFTNAGWPAGGRDEVTGRNGGPAATSRPALPAHVTYIDADCDLDPNDTAALLKACEKLEAEDQHEAELLPPEPKPAPSTFEPWRPYVSENGISTNIGSLGALKRNWGPSRGW
jgi:hypothetical protein